MHPAVGLQTPATPSHSVRPESNRFPAPPQPSKEPDACSTEEWSLSGAIADLRAIKDSLGAVAAPSAAQRVAVIPEPDPWDLAIAAKTRVDLLKARRGIG